MLVRTAGFSGTIFINFNIIQFSFISLAGVISLNLELYIFSVLVKFLGQEVGMLLRYRARPPLLCLLRTIGMEELIRTASSLVIAFSDPLLLTIQS